MKSLRLALYAAFLLLMVLSVNAQWSGHTFRVGEEEFRNNLRRLYESGTSVSSMGIEGFEKEESRVARTRKAQCSGWWAMRDENRNMDAESMARAKPRTMLEPPVYTFTAVILVGIYACSTLIATYVFKNMSHLHNKWVEFRKKREKLRLSEQRSLEDVEYQEEDETHINRKRDTVWVREGTPRKPVYRTLNRTPDSSFGGSSGDLSSSLKVEKSFVESPSRVNSILRTDGSFSRIIGEDNAWLDGNLENKTTSEAIEAAAEGQSDELLTPSQDIIEIVVQENGFGQMKLSEDAASGFNPGNPEEDAERRELQESSRIYDGIADDSVNSEAQVPEGSSDNGGGDVAYTEPGFIPSSDAPLEATANVGDRDEHARMTSATSPNADFPNFIATEIEKEQNDADLFSNSSLVSEGANDLLEFTGEGDKGVIATKLGANSGIIAEEEIHEAIRDVCGDLNDAIENPRSGVVSTDSMKHEPVEDINS